MNDGRAKGNGIVAFHRGGPSKVFSWDVPARHVGGVTDDPDRAAAYVAAELERAPEGTQGTVRSVALTGTGRPGQYGDLGEVRTARRETDGIVWTSEWAPLPGGGAMRKVRVEL